MDSHTIITVLAIGLLVLIGLLWIVWKFFFKLFKYFVIALMVTIAGTGGYFYRMRSYRDPALGKHAYLTENGKYLGIVEASGEDNQRGKVWLIRPPGRYPLMYSKSRVTLKDKREIEKEPKEGTSPTPSASPSASPKKGKR